MKNSTVKTKRARSVAYPAISLPEAIDYTSRLRKELGKGPYSRELASQGIGHAMISGAAAVKIAAMTHYGLLDRVGNAYSQSVLAERIILETSESDKIAAIIEAVKSPKLFSDLFNRFAGHALPVMLSNILVREFRVDEKVSVKVVKVFTESAEFAGLLRNGIVTESPDLKEDTTPKLSIPSASESISTALPESGGYHEYNLWGIKLIIPRSRKTDDAITEGKLSQVRKEIISFAKEIGIKEPLNSDK